MLTCKYCGRNYYHESNCPTGRYVVAERDQLGHKDHTGAVAGTVIGAMAGGPVGALVGLLLGDMIDEDTRRYH